MSDQPVVMITGASSGIGLALSRVWAHQGARVALLARRRERLEEESQNIVEQGQEALAILCDVTDPLALEKAVHEILQKWGRLDIVVANAGFGVVGPIDKISLDDYRRQFETNVFGVLNTLKATLPELRKTRGTFAIMGSIMGYLATPQASAYAMSKFAVRALAESLFFELKSEGVRVKYIAPGFVRSEIRQVNNQGEHIKGARDSIPNWLQMPSDQAARDIVRGIRSSSREIIITRHGKLIVFLRKYFSFLVDFILGRFIQRHRAEPT